MVILLVHFLIDVSVAHSDCDPQHIAENLILWTQPHNIDQFKGTLRIDDSFMGEGLSDWVFGTGLSCGAPSVCAVTSNPNVIASFILQEKVQGVNTYSLIFHTPPFDLENLARMSHDQLMQSWGTTYTETQIQCHDGNWFFKYMPFYFESSYPWIEDYG